MALGKAVVDIMANLEPLTTGLKKALSAVQVSMGKISEVIKSTIGSAISTATRLVKYLTASFAAFAVASVKAFADNEMAIQRFNAIFGESIDKIRDWVNEFAAANRLNQSDVADTAAQFYLIMDAIGITEDKAVEFSKRLTETAYTMRNVYGGSIADIASAVQMGLTGMARGLRSYGIILNEEILKTGLTAEKLKEMEKAVKQTSKEEYKFVKDIGFIRKNRELNESEKAYLRLSAILEQAGKLQSQLSGHTKTLNAYLFELRQQIASTLENFGEGLKILTATGLKRMTDWLVNNQATVIKWGQITAQVIQSVIQYFTKLYEIGKSGGLAAVFETIINNLKDAFVFMQTYLQALYPYARRLGYEIGAGVKVALSEVKSGLSEIAKSGAKTHPYLTGAGLAAAGGYLGVKAAPIIKGVSGLFAGSSAAGAAGTAALSTTAAIGGIAAAGAAGTYFGYKDITLLYDIIGLLQDYKQAVQTNNMLLDKLNERLGE